MITLNATELRALALHLDSLTTTANQTGVRTASDTPDSISMSGWAHSLQVERVRIAAPTEADPAHQNEVYRLVVGSAH